MGGGAGFKYKILVITEKVKDKITLLSQPFEILIIILKTGVRNQLKLEKLTVG